MIHVKVLEEHGLDQALYGIGLSYGITSQAMDYNPTSYMYGRLKTIAGKLASKPEGAVAEAEAKYLRMITLWVRIKAPEYWWMQFDTYKVGVVAQSESKMHTLMKHPIEKSMFTDKVDDAIIAALEEARHQGDWEYLLENLPMGFLQQRIMSMNYAVLRTIIKQRKGHKLPEWASFIDQIMGQVKYPSLLEQKPHV